MIPDVAPEPPNNKEWQMNINHRALNICILFLFAGILYGQIGRETQAAVWPDNGRDLRVHMIGQAHIDPVWLWPWPEGLSVVHSTFRSALDRMNEDQEFAFTASSAQFYEWVAQNDPPMIGEIRKRIEEGRWGLVGGWWVEPDVNLPSGESLVRQGLYGQNVYRRRFGRKAQVAYNPDS
jgi:alpha-mannosidase